MSQKCMMLVVVVMMMMVMVAMMLKISAGSSVFISVISVGAKHQKVAQSNPQCNPTVEH